MLRVPDYRRTARGFEDDAAFTTERKMEHKLAQDAKDRVEIVMSCY